MMRAPFTPLVRNLAAAALLLATVGILRADEAAEPEPDRAEPETRPEQAPRPPPADRFRPSEEVSADQEVDFPADI